MFTLVEILRKFNLFDLCFNIILSKLWRENMNNPNFEDEPPGETWILIFHSVSYVFSGYDDVVTDHANTSVTSFDTYMNWLYIWIKHFI